MTKPLKKTEVEIGIDEVGLYFEAGSPKAHVAFILLLLAETGRQIVEGMRGTSLDRVRANSTKFHPSLWPLERCPDMLELDACAFCFWYDTDRDVCRGG